ncbi:MAG: PAS domain-containing protein, partial [Myxococcota bacterium]
MPRSIPFGLVAGDLEPDSGRPKRSAWLLFAVSLGATVALEQLLELMMGDVPVLLLIVPVAVAALAGGFRLGVVATVVGSLLAAVLILQEHDAQTGGADRLRLAMFGLSGLILSALAERSRRALIREQAARRAAQASSALLDLISRSTPDLIFVRDLEGRLVYANDATIRVLGLEAGPAVGQRLADRFDPALGARVAASDHEVATTGAVVVTEDTVALPGGTRTFRTTKSPVRDSAAAVVGVVGVSTDVTEQRRVTEQVALRDRQLDLTLGASGFRTWEVTLDRDDLDADALLAAALAGLAPTGAVCPGDPIRSRLSRAIAERTGFTEELHLEGVGTGRGRWIELAGR